MLVGMAMDTAAMTAVSPAHELPILPAMAAVWLAAGALIGSCNFLALHWSVGRFAAGGCPALVLVLQLVRFGALAVALGVVARCFGAVPLLVATAGILSARAAVLHWGAPQP
jgi:F1-F0 ATPase (N-ATPase) AtpR subunit